MTTAEEALNQVIDDFATTLAMFSSVPTDEIDKAKREIFAFLNEGLRTNLPYIFTGGSSRLICEITNNRHSFSGNHKHCNNCGADFCTAHSLTHCIKCNHTPLV